MDMYDTKDIEKAINEKIEWDLYVCPFCRKKSFSIWPKEAAIVFPKRYDIFDVDYHLPAGTVVCNNCGHIDFFFLPFLGVQPQIINKFAKMAGSVNGVNSDKYEIANEEMEFEEEMIPEEDMISEEEMEFDDSDLFDDSELNDY